MRKWIIIVVLLLIAAPLAIVGVLLYTPAGLSAIASQLHRLEHRGVRIEGVSGTLAGQLYVRRFELDRPNVHIVSNDIRARLRIRDLVIQTITVTSLTARDTVVEIRNAPPTPPSPTVRFVPGFMRIDVRGAEFTGLRYVNIDGTAVDATRLRGRVRIGPRLLRLREFQIEAPQFKLAGSGRLIAQRPLGLELRVNGDAQLERGTQIAGSAQTSGDIEHLAIQATLLRPDVVNVAALFTRPDGKWRIAGTVASPVFSLEPWMEKPPFSFRNIALKVDARPDGIHAAGNIGVPEWSGRDLTIDVHGKYAQRTLQIAAADVAVNGTPVKAHAAGSVKFGADAPALDVTTSWTSLRWPLDGDPLFDSASGTLSLAGSMPYNYELNAQIALPAQLTKTAHAIEAETQSRGVLARDGITLNEYTVQALDGSLTGKGSLQFGQPRAWTLTAAATRINPEQLNAQFAGSVNFNLDAHGTGFDKQATFAASLAALSGTLRNQPLHGHGRVERDRKGWRAQGVELQLGDARASLDGTMKGTVDARMTFHARELHTLFPDAYGSIDVTGSARGPAKAPRIVANVHAEQLRYAQWRIASIIGEGDIDLGGTNPSRATLTITNAGQTEPVVQSLRIDGAGMAGSHQIDVAMVGIGDANNPPPHVDLKINGRYANQTWSGTLLATDIANGRQSGESVAMTEPANFVIARDRLLIEKLCLALGRGQFCGEGKWQRNGPWEGTVSGYEIPLAILLPPSGPETEYGGRIEGRVHASGTPGQPWLLDAGARIIDAAITYKRAGAEPETLNLGNGGLSATATAAKLDFSFGVQAFEDTFLYANAHIERNSRNDLLHLPLTGDIKARAADANILPVVFSEIDDAAGLLTANVDLRGSLAAPEINGRIELTKGSLDSYRINLALRNLSLVADLANNGLDFRGTGNAGDGRLDVDGHFLWKDLVLRGSLQIKGDNLLVSDLPEYRVVASPDLRFKFDGRQVDVAGELAIPSALIHPANLSGAVQASDDARYTGETAAERSGQMSIRSEVRIRLGDDVRVDAFGLQAKVVGGVGTTVITGETALGRGELSVADGRYQAYGQKLDITRGRLLFDASPLDDPGLDIEAQRKIENIKVGMNVRGTLRAPRLSFFSDPSMPQTQIVSYLLVGKGIENMQSGDAAAMGNTTDTLAVQGGGFLASRLGRQLGLEEVGVESSRTTSGEVNTSLVLGKFLSPRLFISYGISLTESINTFKLRYTVSDKWMLKMEAGEVQSADAEYTIER
ncbi:MAG TPA: translocation/assembly module TamB domain-containing protein [Povalibacter sp.]